MQAILPADQEIMKAHYGEPIGKTVRAVAMVEDDRVLGVAGSYLDGTRVVVFGSFTEDLRKKPKLLLRGCKEVQRIAGRAGLPVQALADRSIEAAGRFLEHLGFSNIGGEIYEWRP